MNYTLDTLIEEVANELQVADPQAIRFTTIRLLRTDFFRQIGYELVGLPFGQQLPVEHGRVNLTDDVLMITDAGLSEYRMEGVTTVNHGRASVCQMVYDARGVSFPYYPMDTIWVRGYLLPKTPDGDVLIPMECYAAALEWLIAKQITSPLHPRYSEKRQMLIDANVLIGASRAALVPRGDAADRTQREFFGLSRYR